MRTPKAIFVATAFLAIVGLGVDARAQCPNGRVFRSAGKPGVDVYIDVTGTDEERNEIGRFWDTADASLSHNGLVGPDFGNLCPVDEWWTPKRNGDYWIDGGLTVGACAQTGCPGEFMTLVVEDYGAGGPGFASTAYYIGFLVDEVPAESRWYDYARVDGITSPTTLSMREFPRLIVTGTDRWQTTILINYELRDEAPSNHTWDNGAQSMLPTSAIVAEWQVVRFTGFGDPGRLRSNGWVTVRTIPYQEGGAFDVLTSVACQDVIMDEYLAVGIGFNGGAAGVIDSALVGEAVQLECDPNLAEPDLPQDVPRKPTAQPLDGQPGRRTGRR
jgi:hypothetical protein